MKKALSVSLLVLLLVSITTILEMTFFPIGVDALPIFARKYKKACFHCHTAIPKNSEYGERFLFNGFQDPDEEPDGGETGKFIPEGDEGMLALDVKIPVTIGLKFSPLTYNSNGMNGSDTKVRPSWNVGARGIKGALYTAGTYNKNLSYFFEGELAQEESELEQVWVQISNIGGRNLAHLRFGLLPITDYASFTAQRRIIPDDYLIMSSSAKTGGSGGLRIGGRQSAIEIHGRPFGDYSLAYSIAVFNGGQNTVDVDNFKDFSVMLRYDLNDMLNFSVLGLFGTDTKPNSSGTNNNYESDRIKSHVGIYQFAGNFRYRDINIYGQYVIQEEDNALYSSSSPRSGGLFGATGQVDYFILKDVMLSGRIDYRREHGALRETGKKATTFIPQITYLLTQNVLFRLNYTIDMQGQFFSAEKRYRNKNHIFNVFFLAVF